MASPFRRVEITVYEPEIFEVTELATQTSLLPMKVPKTRQIEFDKHLVEIVLGRFASELPERRRIG